MLAVIARALSLLSKSLINERWILSPSTGSSLRVLSEDYPVPKSSMAVLIPRALNAANCSRAARGL